MSEPRMLAGLLAELPPHGAAPAPFPSDPVTEEEVGAVLAAARVAPSADNAQTWRFVVVRAATTRIRLGSAVIPGLAPALAAAPVVIAACGIPWVIARTRREQPYVMLDVPIAVCQMLLLAEELGLACAWTMESDEDEVRCTLGIPQGVRVIALLALGRAEPAPTRASAPRPRGDR